MNTRPQNDEIDRLIPHRYPFAFVDDLIPASEPTRLQGIKYISKNDRYLISGRNSLLCESLAQLSKILDYKMSDNTSEEPDISYLTRLDIQWFASVRVGDKVRLDVKFMREVGGMRSYNVSASVERVTIFRGSISRKVEHKRNKSTTARRSKQ